MLFFFQTQQFWWILKYHIFLTAFITTTREKSQTWSQDGGWPLAQIAAEYEPCARKEIQKQNSTLRILDLDGALSIKY